MDSSVVFWEFLVIAFIFTATIIASEFVRRWLEKIEKDNIQSETENSNLVFERKNIESEYDVDLEKLQNDQEKLQEILDRIRQGD